MTDAERSNRILNSKIEIRDAAADAIGRRIPLALVEVAKATFHASDRNVADLLQILPPPRPVECRRGCDTCCSVRTAGVFPEVYAVAQHLRASRPPEELAALMARLRAFGEATRGKGLDQLTLIECPFLEDHACSVHAVRPNGCRRYTSYSAAACRDSAANYQWVKHVPGSSVLHHVAEFPQLGLFQAIVDLQLDARTYELAPAVYEVLTDATIAGRWLAGEQVLGHTVIPGSEQLTQGTIATLRKMTPWLLRRLVSVTAEVEYPLVAKGDLDKMVEHLNKFLTGVPADGHKTSTAAVKASPRPLTSWL